MQVKRDHGSRAKGGGLYHSAKDQHIQELERQLQSVNEELKAERQELLSVQEVDITLWLKHAFEVLYIEYTTRRVRSRDPIQHEVQPSTVLPVQDQMLYSARSTYRAWHTFTGILYFELAPSKKLLIIDLLHILALYTCIHLINSLTIVE